MQYFFEIVETIEEGKGFTHFDTAHLLWLSAFVIFTVVALLVYKRLPDTKRTKFRRIIAGLIVAEEIIKIIFLSSRGFYSRHYLPLHLCSINIFMIVWHSVKSNKALDNYLYAIGIPAAMMGLLFPAWTELPAWNFMSIHSFTVHILLAAYPIIVTLGGDIKPDVKCLPKALLILLGLALPVYGINLLLHTNFMFLMGTEPGSPLYFFQEKFGNHLIGFPALLIPILIIMYAPVYIYKMATKKTEK